MKPSTRNMLARHRATNQGGERPDGLLTSSHIRRIIAEPMRNTPEEYRVRDAAWEVARKASRARQRHAMLLERLRRQWGADAATIDRAACLVRRLDWRLPDGPGNRYPKTGQHDSIVARLPNDLGGSERVVRNRTGSRYVYIDSASGWMTRHGVTTSKVKGERWRVAVGRKARVLRFLANVERQQSHMFESMPC